MQGVAAGNLRGHAVEEADRAHGPHRPALEGSVRETPVVRIGQRVSALGWKEGREGMVIMKAHWGMFFVLCH